MAVNPLPPQAYTKETLQKAYQWLLNQNASIKEMASNQEILVSLYLKAQRNGEAALEAPSIQNFKQELKSLANMMGDFQGPPAAALQTPPPAMTTYPAPPIIASPSRTTAALDLDSHSLSLVQEVKVALNLSSDTEALRALISVGHKQLKRLT